MVAQGEINQFALWNTKELKEWVETICLFPALITKHNTDTYLQAAEELNIKEEIYEDCKVLH